MYPYSLAGAKIRGIKIRSLDSSKREGKLSKALGSENREKEGKVESDGTG